jgi:hypothetical protein
MSKRNSRAGKARRRGQARRDAARAPERPSGIAGSGQEGRSGAPQVLEARLSRFCFPGDEEASWSAEWGLQDDPVGIEDSSQDLRQLVGDIVDDARSWAGRHGLVVEWDLSGDAPAGMAVQDMVAAAGVTLPPTISPA